MEKRKNDNRIRMLLLSIVFFFSITNTVAFSRKNGRNFRVLESLVWQKMRTMWTHNGAFCQNICDNLQPAEVGSSEFTLLVGFDSKTNKCECFKVDELPKMGHKQDSTKDVYLVECEFNLGFKFSSFSNTFLENHSYRCF